MDEEFWLTCTDPLALLAALHPMCTLGSEPPQTRLSRLYLIACARRQWNVLPPICRKLVTLAEAYAESPQDEKVLHAAASPIAERLMNSGGEPADLREAETELAALDLEGYLPAPVLARLNATDSPTPPLAPAPKLWPGLAALVYLPFEFYTPTYHWIPPRLHSLSRLREVYGNPYRLVEFHQAWRTDTVLTLARQMYESREFGAMPIMADAIQEAGCDNDDILKHCRAMDQVHVRGCWVLDRALALR